MVWLSQHRPWVRLGDRLLHKRAPTRPSIDAPANGRSWEPAQDRARNRLAAQTLEAQVGQEEAQVEEQAQEQAQLSRNTFNR